MPMIASGNTSSAQTLTLSATAKAAGAYDTAYHWLAAWAALILLLMALNQTETGHVAIYYSLVLLLLLVFAVQYQAISDLLSPFSKLPDATNAAHHTTQTATGTTTQSQVPTATTAL